MANVLKKYLFAFIILITVIGLYEVYCLKWSVKEFTKDDVETENINISEADNLLMEYYALHAKVILLHNSGKVVVFKCRGDFCDLYGVQTNIFKKDKHLEILEVRKWQATPLEYLILKYRFLRINYRNTPNNLMSSSDAFNYYIEHGNKRYNYRGPMDKGEKQVIDPNTKGEPVVYKLLNEFVRGEFKRFNDILQSGDPDKLDEEEVRRWYDV